MKLKLSMMLALSFIVSAAQGQIPKQFFGMGSVSSTDLPKVPYGVMSHPQLAWTAIEGTARGTYNWDGMDQFVNAAPKDANGTALVDMPLGWTPSWAVSSQASCHTQTRGLVYCTAPPDNIQDWIDFVTELAAHYNGVTAPQVKFYEIWNEVNTPPFYTGTVEQMITMAQAAYPILKKNPNSLVLTPSVTWSPNGTGWMTSYLSGGGSSVADGVTFHGYPSKTGNIKDAPIPLPESSLSTNAPIQTMITSFRTVADTNGMMGKPLLTTEGGWGVNGVTDPDMQAAWIAQYEIVQAGLAAANNLRAQTWYTWGHAQSGTIETTSGAVTPAGMAYQQVVSKWLLGTSPSACQNSGNIWTCEVGTKLIVWDASQTCSNGVCTTSVYTPPNGYTQYIDLTGVVHNISGTINLGVKPILMKP